MEYKVIQIGQLADAKFIEEQINFLIKKGMKLEFMTEKFMVFVKLQEKQKKNEKTL